MSIATLHIWIPRPRGIVRPRWLRGLPAWFTDEIQEGSDGGTKEGSDGSIRQAGSTSTPCCCTPKCSACADGAPEGYELTFSGIAGCSCFTNAGRWMSTGSFGGTFALAASATPCAWEYTDPGLIIGSVYSGSACTSVTTLMTGILIRATFNGSLFAVQVNAGQGGPGGSAVLFGCSITTSRCSDSMSAANTLTCDGTHGGAGGSVVITPL